MAIKDIKEEDLTEEQRTAVIKLYFKFRFKNAVAISLYVGFLFFANFLAITINKTYMHNEPALYLLYLTTGVVVLTGLRGTLAEQRDALVIDAEKIVGSTDEK